MNERGPDSPSRLQQWGVNYFRRLSSELEPVRADDETHILNEQERSELLKIERWTVARAGLIGAVAGLACVLAAMLAEPLLHNQSEDAGLFDSWSYTLVVLVSGALITLVEIAFLYWDALRSVHKLAYKAGLDLFPESGERTAVVNALVQAALELPGTRRNVYAESGRELSKWVVLVVTLLYKLKVTLTAFIVKAMVKRLAGRVAVRAYIDFVGIPLYCFWDAFVARLVMREARIRAMGPSAVHEIAVELFRRHPHNSEDARRAALLAISTTIARNTELHPNLDCLMREFIILLGEPQGEDLGGSQEFFEVLQRLDADDQRFALTILEVASMIDGRLSRWEGSLLKEAQAVCGRQPSLENAKRMRRQFRAGRHVTIEA